MPDVPPLPPAPEKPSSFRSKRILAAALVLVLIVIGAVFLYAKKAAHAPAGGGQNAALPVSVGGSSSSAAPLAPRSSQQEFVAEIIKSGNLSRCDEVSGVILNGTDYKTVCRDNISLNLAISTHNVALCDDLSSSFMSKDHCVNEVIQDIAHRAALKECAKISSADTRSSCVATYWSVQAVNRGDTSLCGNIPDSKGKDSCNQQVLFEEFTANPLKMSCAAAESVASRSDCAALQDALQNDDRESCAKIQQPLLQQACYEQL